MSKQSAPNTACTGQVRAFAHTFGIQPQTADSASGGFVRQVPPLPVTPAVMRLSVANKRVKNEPTRVLEIDDWSDVDGADHGRVRRSRTYARRDLCDSNITAYATAYSHSSPTDRNPNTRDSYTRWTTTIYTYPRFL
jgi:hypothetical protein